MKGYARETHWNGPTIKQLEIFSLKSNVYEAAQENTSAMVDRFQKTENNKAKSMND